MITMILNAGIVPATIEIMDQEARRLTHLVENLLHFSRSERRSLRVSPTPTLLGPLVRSIVESFTPLADTRHLRLRVEITGNHYFSKDMLLRPRREVPPRGEPRRAEPLAEVEQERRGDDGDSPQGHRRDGGGSRLRTSGRRRRPMSSPESAHVHAGYFLVGGNQA